MRAYLLIAVPATIVAVFYFALFRSMALPLRATPFLGAIGGFARSFPMAWVNSVSLTGLLN